MKKIESISNATLNRMPTYLRYLRRALKDGKEYISSVTIAEDLSLNSVQVKKDLALVSTLEGKPKKGFELNQLVYDIEAYLGVNDDKKAIIVGVGKLGTALLSYKGFQKYGLQLAAGFDINEQLHGNVIGGAKIYSMEDVADYVKEHNVKMAIVAVQAKVAQSVCDQLVESGINAILNFAPTNLIVPKGVRVRDVDIAASLAILATLQQR